MKKIWLRKEREDSKSLQEAKSELQSEVVSQLKPSNQDDSKHNTENFTKQSSQEDLLISTNNRLRPESGKLSNDENQEFPAEKVTNNDSRFARPTLSTSSLHYPGDVFSINSAKKLIPHADAGTAFPSTYFETMDSSLVNSAYVLALGRPSMSFLGPEDSRQQGFVPGAFAFFRVDNALPGFSFPSANTGGCFVVDHSGKREFAVNDRSTRSEFKPHDRSKYGYEDLTPNSQSQSYEMEYDDRFRHDRPVFRQLAADARCAYPLVESSSVSSNNIVANRSLKSNTESFDNHHSYSTKQHHNISNNQVFSHSISSFSSSTLLSSELATFRKRAPNSPLQIPVTPTTSNGSTPAAFVVPRQVTRLVNNIGRNPGDYGFDQSSRPQSSEARPGSQVNTLIPTMIAGLSALEVKNQRIGKHDGKQGKDSKYFSKEAEIVIVDDDKDPKVVCGDHRCVPNASKGEERSNCCNSKGCTPVSSDIPGIDWKAALNKKVSTGIERKIRQHNNINNNNIDNNCNSSRSEVQHWVSQANPSFCTTAATSNATQHFSVSVSNNSCHQVPTPTLASSSISLSTTAIQKEQQSLASSAPPPARGKGRPAKVIGTEVCISAGGSRSVIKCPICSKVFNNSSALAKHKLTHSDERKYSCHLCSKAFKRQDHLNGHMMTHSSKKPFECRFLGCSKSYCDARSLRRHLENHHQDSINSCLSSMVGEKIEISSAPISHVDQSNPLPSSDSDGNLKEVWVPGYNPLDEPKPVRCHVCGRCFKNVPALNGHMRLHGGYVNRDLEEGDKNPPSEPVSSTHSNQLQDDLVQNRREAESGNKIQSVQPRASSLESLPSLVHPSKSHDSRFKSHTLPREEPKNKDVGRLDGHDHRLQKTTTVEANADTVASKSRTYGHSVSSILDFSKEECQDQKYQSYSNYLEHETQRKMPTDYSRQPARMLVGQFHESDDLSRSHEILEASRCHKGVDMRPALKVETEFSNERFSGSHTMSSKLLSTLLHSQISPQHLEASSLYQRRRRRFSERSPNSEENSGQGTETSSMAASEKSYEDEIKDDQDCSYHKGFHDNVYSGHDYHDESRTSKGVFSSLNTSAHSVDLKDSQSLKEQDVIEPGEVRLHDIKSLHQNFSFSSSHPAQVNTAQAHFVQENSKALQSGYFPASCEQGTNPSSSAQVVVTPNAHGFVESSSTVYQQSHSSLPCTPYTAHTPYTPRTTGPGSPKQASLFQFPPFHQHEGATPEESGGAKMPPDVGSAYVPEAFMGARISLRNDHGLPEGASCPELTFKDSKSENFSGSYESVKSKKHVNYHCRSSRERREVLLPESREKTELSEKISERESLGKPDLESRGKDFEKSANFYSKVSGRSRMSEEQFIGNSHVMKDNGAVPPSDFDKFLQPMDNKKLSARRKACPAPLILQPPSNLSKEKYFHYQSQLRSPRVLNSVVMTGTQGVDISSLAPPYTPPPMLSPVRSGTGLYWTTLQSAGSSVDSGCPKSSARFSMGSACSFSSQECLLPQTGDSAISYKFTPSISAEASNRTCFDDGATAQLYPRINIGDSFQASIPKFRGGVSRQKEKSELVSLLHNSAKMISEKNGRSNWSSTEVQMFSRAIMAVEKDFSKISKMVASKSMNDCIEFYYTWKKSHWNDYERLKARKRKVKEKHRIKDLRHSQNLGSKSLSCQ